MAKGNSNGPTVHVKVKPAKTAKQLAKASENAAIAQKRLAELQAAQRAGFKSVADQKAAIANAAAREWLARVFNVRHYGSQIQRWLATRIEQPATEVKALVVAFLARENNAKMAQIVAEEAFGGFKEELKIAA